MHSEIKHMKEKNSSANFLDDQELFTLTVMIANMKNNLDYVVLNPKEIDVCMKIVDFYSEFPKFILATIQERLQKFVLNKTTRKDDDFVQVIRLQFLPMLSDVAAAAYAEPSHLSAFKKVASSSIDYELSDFHLYKDFFSRFSSSFFETLVTFRADIIKDFEQRAVTFIDKWKKKERYGMSDEEFIILKTFRQYWNNPGKFCLGKPSDSESQDCYLVSALFFFDVEKAVGHSKWFPAEKLLGKKNMKYKKTGEIIISASVGWTGVYKELVEKTFLLMSQSEPCYKTFFEHYSVYFRKNEMFDEQIDIFSKNVLEATGEDTDNDDVII